MTNGIYGINITRGVAIVTKGVAIVMGLIIA